MNQAFESSQVDESPKGAEVGYPTLTDITGVEILQHVVAMPRINLRRSLREDETIVV